MTRTTRAVGVAAAFALGLVLWLHRVHIERPTAIDFGVADLIHFFEPVARHLHREYARGAVPLWNPWQLAGVPLLAAHQAAALYPPNVLAYGLLPPARALETLAVLHLGLAGAGTWLFAARLGLGAPAAAAAALAFMLSAQLLKTVYNPPSLATMAWLPWLLWAVDGLVRTRTLRCTAAVALTAGFAFLAGYAQGTVYAVQLATLYGALATFLWVPRGTRGAVAWRALLASALAVGLAAAQLLPTLELATNGVRGLGGLTLAQAGYGSLDPAALYAPWVLLRERGTPEGVSWITWRAASVPLVALPLTLLALVGRPRRVLGAFFAVVAGLAGLLMLGPQAWVYRIYHALPLGGLFRVPVRFDLVYAFAVALLVGIGAQTAREAVARRRGTRAGAVLAVLLTFVVGVDGYAESRLPFVHPAVADPDAYESRAFARLLREESGRRGFVVEGAVLTWKLGTRYAVPVVPDYEAALPSDYERYFTGSTGGGYHPWHGDVRLAGPPWGFGRPGRPPEQVVRLLDLMSVGLYAIDPTTPTAQRNEIETTLAGPWRRLGRGWVVARPQGLPRAYVVHDVVVEPDPDRALAILLAESFDARRRAVVGHGLAPLEPSAAPEAARLVEELPTRMTVSATCAAACLLVTTDLSYPGWRATVDGRATEIVTTNVLYRGVPLQAGAHEVVFRYRPGSFMVGAAVSLLSVAALAWMML